MDSIRVKVRVRDRVKILDMVPISLENSSFCQVKVWAQIGQGSGQGFRSRAGSVGGRVRGRGRRKEKEEYCNE